MRQSIGFAFKPIRVKIDDVFLRKCVEMRRNASCIHSLDSLLNVLLLDGISGFWDIL